jgi:hypothetical protein
VQTGPSGALELQFVDKTHLALGSSSAVKLDRFVYDGTKSSSIVLGLTKGAFRFATGSAPKKSYKIATPLAAIGVRGTRFNAKVANGVLTVTLEEGGLDVCSRGGRNCASLNKRNETVEVRRDGTIRRANTAFLPTFFCSQSSGGSLCTPYGSQKGAIDPSGGGGATTSPKAKAKASASPVAPPSPPPSRPPSPPPSPPPGNPDPGPGGGDDPDYHGDHHGGGQRGDRD